MPLPALLLVLLAAALHAGWNYLSKASRDTTAFLWWGVAFGALGYGLFLLLTSSIFLSPKAWPYFLVSDLAELGYFVTLVRGYSRGDLSLVYPISRGSAPLFIALWSGVLFGERLAPAGYVGILLMVAGIYVASFSSSERSPATEAKPARFPRLPVKDPAVWWALASGVFVSIYSLSDKIVVNSMPPLVYNWWVYAGNTVTWLPVVWTTRRRAGNLAELRSNWPRLLLGSAMTVGAYVAVLVALTMTSASYVVAGRGTSVVIGALLGTFLLGDAFGRMRLIGACLLFAGLVVIALA